MGGDVYEVSAVMRTGMKIVPEVVISQKIK